MLSMKEQYSDIIKQIDDQLGYNKERAVRRFLLIKEYEESYNPAQRKKLGSSYRSNKAVAEYCHIKNISTSSFYRWLGAYHRHGIRALVSKFGNNVHPEPDKKLQLVKDYEENYKSKGKSRLRGDINYLSDVSRYCLLKSISINSFYRWLALYNKYGANAFKPNFIENIKSDVEHKPKTRHECHYIRRGDKITSTITINVENPLLCLKQIKSIIERSPAIAYDTKVQALKLINRNFEAIRRKDNLSIDPPLTSEELLVLKKHKAMNHKKNSVKASAILMANDNSSMLDVMAVTGKATSTIYRWLYRFKIGRLASIEVIVNAPEREKRKAERQTRVIDIIHKHPSLYNINRTSWSIDAIIQAFEAEYGERLSRTVVQHVIKSTGYSWRHARRVLTSPDPEYKAKVNRLLDALHSLKDGDVFFFLDEVGPYKVKKYGGLSLVRDKDPSPIPLYQKPKGHIQFVAALEALSNQMSWLFTPDKGSMSVIALLEKLVREYGHCRRMCFTWDAIAVHSSKIMTTWIETHNQRGVGPLIEIVPLPSNAQFLNVIEAVFGGMKRAVICNSNYANAKEMQDAIGRYFEERNQYYRDNPKRAGDKIWDKQRFDIDRLIGGLFKKM